MDKSRLPASQPLRSNDPPDPHEAALLHRVSDEMTAKVNNPNMVYHRQPELQVQSQNKVQTRLAHLRTAISSSRQLPLELLAEIIALAVPETSSEEGRASLIRACLVSKSWRAAALSKHCLWASLELELGCSPFNRVAQWFQRSGSLPRSLRICTRRSFRHDYDIYNMLLVENVAKILERGPQLDEIHLSMDTTCQWNNILPHLDRTPPSARAWNSLRSLGLKFDSLLYQPSFWRLPPVQAFQLYLPSMESAFSLVESCASTRFNFAPQFLVGLTSLRIHCNWHLNPLVHILEQSNNLQTLHLGFESRPFSHSEGWEVYGRLKARPLEFRKLKELHLENLASLEFLMFIQAPLLQHLQLDFHNAAVLYQTSFKLRDNEIWPVFVQRHQAITSLVIHDVQCDPETFKVMFSPTNNLLHLTHLTLDRVVWKSKFTSLRQWLRLFSPRNLLQYVQVYPSLQNVKILRVDNDFLELEALLDFVEAQQKDNAGSDSKIAHDEAMVGIKDFELTFHNRFGRDALLIDHSPELQARIAAANQGGVRVRVGPTFEAPCPGYQYISNLDLTKYL
ncbi:hypothetical protein NMY22_g1409 [Coprinellus aureogranulatus]|nr:hypothetical protein NMY22_g1409 [Coprinellus aureogranulatus]